MLLVASGPTPSSWNEQAFVHAVFAQQLHPQTPVSTDGGRSWHPAWPTAQQLSSRGDDGLAVVLPVNVEGWSMAAGYAAIFSAFFWGGPIDAGIAVFAFDAGAGVGSKLIAILVGLLLGPLPIAAFALIGFRRLRKNPTLRGKGRAIFALVVAALLTLVCLSGLVGVVVRR